MEVAYPLAGITEGTQGSYIRLTGVADDDEEDEDGMNEVDDEVEEEPYFDASMSPTYTAYLGKTATLTCIVHAAKSDKSVRKGGWKSREGWEDGKGEERSRRKEEAVGRVSGREERRGMKEEYDERRA